MCDRYTHSTIPLLRVFSEGTYCGKDCHVHSFQNVVTDEGDDVSNKVMRTRGLLLPWKNRLRVFVLGPTVFSKLNWGSRRLTIRKLADAVDLSAVEFIKAPLVWQEEMTRMEVPGKALVASEGVEVKEGSEGGTRTTAVVEATKIKTRREGSVDEISVGPAGVPSCRSAFGIS